MLKPPLSSTRRTRTDWPNCTESTRFPRGKRSKQGLCRLRRLRCLRRREMRTRNHPASKLNFLSARRSDLWLGFDCSSKSNTSIGLQYKFQDILTTSGKDSSVQFVLWHFQSCSSSWGWASGRTRTEGPPGPICVRCARQSKLDDDPRIRYAKRQSAAPPPRGRADGRPGIQSRG